LKIADLNGLRLHYRDEGDEEGAAIVFANSLGTDLRLWDEIVPRLPRGLRIIRYDKRGHGLSDCPPGPYTMDDLVDDAEALLKHLSLREVAFVGLSIGGMIAQGLAARRPGLIRAMVISNTAARIGTPEMWQERIDAIRAGGIEALADGVIERWFSPAFRETDELIAWRNMLIRQPVEGYVGCSAAIAGADLTDGTGTLTLPTLAIAGSTDGSTPPDLVKATADLIPDSRFHLIEGAGHLPCVESPMEYAETLTGFLAETGHV
jgi:3-oxoadipate enol-lactonase